MAESEGDSTKTAMDVTPKPGAGEAVGKAADVSRTLAPKPAATPGPGADVPTRTAMDIEPEDAAPE